jgi:hypothetical protein
MASLARSETYLVWWWVGAYPIAGDIDVIDIVEVVDDNVGKITVIEFASASFGVFSRLRAVMQTACWEISRDRHKNKQEEISLSRH